MADKFEGFMFKAILSYVAISGIFEILGLICCNIEWKYGEHSVASLNPDYFISLMLITTSFGFICVLFTCVVKVMIEKFEKAKAWYIEWRKTRAEITIKKRIEMK